MASDQDHNNGIFEQHNRPSAISAAKSAGKKLIVEEWGSLVGSGRDANLASNIQKMNKYGVSFYLHNHPLIIAAHIESNIHLILRSLGCTGNSSRMLILITARTTR